MRRAFRILRWLLAIIIVLVVLILIGGYGWLRRSLPQVTGEVRVPGISAPVQIVRDADAIPHIFAANRNDAIFGLGYVHAQERLWQMEFQRRIGQGRLSEILGDATIGTDRFLRTLGVYRAAEQALDAISADSRAAIDAYVAGINAFLNDSRRSLPPEFTLLGLTPEPWTPADVLVWQKMMAWDLGGNWDRELLFADLIGAVGPERAADLLPRDARLEPSIVAALPRGDYGGLLTLNAEVRALLGVTGFSGDGLGSNNWVISGARSTTGQPLLADDPHLGARLPSIWFLAHLSAPDYEVIGATLPGLPGFPIGRNRAIAWGVTNVGPDVQDLYRERLDPAGLMAEFEGRLEPMRIITETIRVAGGDPVTHTVRITRHGPLISDVLNINRAEAAEDEGSDRAPALEPLALRWTALDPDDTTIDAFLGINQAQSWDDFRAALRAYIAPAQNFVYADINGNIGYYAPGRYPIRASGDGLLPAEGWSGRQEWVGFVPFEEQPQAFNPPQGFIATANNRPTPPDYPYDLGREWALPYRYQRIVELIRAKDRLGPDDMAAIQADTVSLHARELLPRLLELVGAGDDSTADAIELLRGWDGDTRGDSAAAAIFQAWYRHLPRAIAGDELGTRLIERYEGQFTLARPFVGATLADIRDPWCDDAGTAERETCADIATSTLQDALDDLRERLGADMDRWRWDRLHLAVFPHQPFDSVPALRRLLSRAVPNGGDNSTVNVGPFSFDEPFQQTHVPGYRQIIDLADPNGGRFIHAGGQSGHFLSPHYDDYLADWQAVRYRPMRMDRDVIEAAGATTLRLEPGTP